MSFAELKLIYAYVLKKGYSVYIIKQKNRNRVLVLTNGRDISYIRF